MRLRFIPRTRLGVLRMLILLSILPALFLVIWLFTIRMPGQSHAGPLPPRSPEQRALEADLARHVRTLAQDIGERSARRYDATQRAASYVEETLRHLGYEVRIETYTVAGREQRNIEATLQGGTRPHAIILIGAHYDSAVDAPGADDNASGVAGMLELARLFANRRVERTLRFVGFGTEEPPAFPTADMGSRHYADRARARGDSIEAMIAVESIGYFDPSPGTQRYPFPLNLAYPDAGDFIGFVSNLKSRALLRRAIATFRRTTALPTQGAAAPWWIPGVWWSDHWPFWRQGYRAIMITDTAPYRNPFYHTPQDTADKLDYRRMALVVQGLAAIVDDLAS